MIQNKTKPETSLVVASTEKRRTITVEIDDYDFNQLVEHFATPAAARSGGSDLVTIYKVTGVTGWDDLLAQARERIKAEKKDEPEKTSAEERSLVVFGEGAALASVAGAVFTPEQIKVLKHYEPSFDFGEARPIYTKRESYSLNMLHGARFREQSTGFEVISGPLCAAYYDGAARLDIGKWKAGLYTLRETDDKRKVADLVFAYRKGKTTYIVSMSAWESEMQSGFVTDPSKLTQSFRYYARTLEGENDWKTVYRRGGNAQKRVPILTLVKEGWQYNEECYPKYAFPKADEKAAVQCHASGERKSSGGISLVSNGAGDMMFFKHFSLFRREGFLDVELRDAKGVVTEHRFNWKHDGKGDKAEGRTREWLECADAKIDPVFESYILHSHWYI